MNRKRHSNWDQTDKINRKRRYVSGCISFDAGKIKFIAKQFSVSTKKGNQRAASGNIRKRV